MMKMKNDSIYLSESIQAIYLDPHQAKMIWQENKNLIIQSINFKGLGDKTFYVVGGNDCYGVIKFKGETKEMNIEEFGKSSERHRISEKERLEKWGDKKKLFSYEFDFVKKFDFPKRVAKGKPDSFIGSVEFLSEISIPGIEGSFKEKKAIDDFFCLIGSSKLVGSMSEPKAFIDKLIGLVKTEPEFVKIKIVEPLSEVEVVTQFREFFDEASLVSHLFGG